MPAERATLAPGTGLAPGLARWSQAEQCRPSCTLMLHALVVGGVELDHVEPAALAVERLEPRRVLVGEPAALEGLGAAADLAEGRQALRGVAAALALHRLHQRRGRW